MNADRVVRPSEINDLQKGRAVALLSTANASRYWMMRCEDVVVQACQANPQRRVFPDFAGTRAAMLAALLLLGACAMDKQAGVREPETMSRLRVAAAAEASGQSNIALSMYGAAATAEPGNVEVQARFAEALTRSDNVMQAEEVLNRALARSPSDARLLVRLGRLRLRTGAAEAALGLFNRVLAVSSRDADALNGRGVAFDLLGQHVEAQQSYRAALSAAPDNLATANNLGLSLLLSGQLQEAVAVLETASQRANAPARVATNLSIARAAAGDKAGARAMLGDQVNEPDFKNTLKSLRSGWAGMSSS